MAAYRRVDDLRSPAGWLPVHRDHLRAQRSVSSMGSLYLFYRLVTSFSVAATRASNSLPTELNLLLTSTHSLRREVKTYMYLFHSVYRHRHTGWLALWCAVGLQLSQYKYCSYCYCLLYFDALLSPRWKIRCDAMLKSSMKLTQKLLIHHITWKYEWRRIIWILDQGRVASL